jgi:hypothetical protein
VSRLSAVHGHSELNNLFGLLKLDVCVTACWRRAVVVTSRHVDARPVRPIDIDARRQTTREIHPATDAGS